MKKLLLFVAVALMAVSANAWNMAGNGSAESGWCCGESWNPAGCYMDETPEGMSVYTATIPAGTYQFKVTNGTWDESYGYWNVIEGLSTPGYLDGGSNNVMFTVAAEATISVKFFAEDHSIVLTSSIPFGPLSITSWTIAGDARLLGVEWDPTNEENDMIPDDMGNFVLKKYPVFLASGEYEYKAAANHNWDTKNIPDGMDNMKLVINEDGTYSVTFTLDPDNEELDAEATKLSSADDVNADSNGAVKLYKEGKGVVIVLGDRSEINLNSQKLR